mmetsp:Transcript_18570/g.37941  ORF Transcript_18570/g.37941 Transcript_18570/m.37941 type:complete len:260 (-) Transcript_18570:213-992(-)
MWGAGDLGDFGPDFAFETTDFSFLTASPGLGAALDFGVPLPLSLVRGLGVPPTPFFLLDCEGVGGESASASTTFLMRSTSMDSFFTMTGGPGGGAPFPSTSCMSTLPRRPPFFLSTSCGAPGAVRCSLGVREPRPSRRARVVHAPTARAGNLPSSHLQLLVQHLVKIGHQAVAFEHSLAYSHAEILLLVPVLVVPVLIRRVGVQRWGIGSGIRERRSARTALRACPAHERRLPAISVSQRVSILTEDILQASGKLLLCV